MMLLDGGPDFRGGVGLGAQVRGEAGATKGVVGVAESGNMEWESKGGSVGRLSWEEGIGVGVGQMKKICEGARVMVGVRLRRRLWWKWRRWGSASSGWLGARGVQHRVCRGLGELVIARQIVWWKVCSCRLDG